MATSAAPTYQDYYNIGVATSRSKRPEILINDGDISDMMLAGAAAMADRVTGYAAERFRATYLDGCSGDDLTILADDHWNIQRFAAVPSAADLVFNRAGSGSVGTIAAGQEIATIKDAQGNEIRFTLDADYTTPSGSFTSGTKTATAEIAGKIGDVAATTIKRFVTPIFDTSITVSNAAAAAGGEDEESDDDLRTRVRAVPTTLRRATLAAIQYGALQVPNVKRATVVDLPDGIINVYITDLNGNFSSPMVTATLAELEKWRAAGALVQVFGGAIIDPSTTLGGNISITLGVRAGVSIAVLTPLIKQAIIQALLKLNVGAVLYDDYIKAAVRSVSPGILSVTTNLPLFIVPNPNEIFRTASDGSEITVV